MDVLQAVFLGVVQGVTEFLPISSSGHLILARELFNIESVYGLSFDAVLQLATSLAVLVYFRKEFFELASSFFLLLARKPVEGKQKVLLFALILGTIPAAIFGLLLEGYMESAWRSAEVVAYTLLIGSALFYAAERFGTQRRELTVLRGLGVGLFQVLALVPGMSRSGSTISGGLLLGLTRQEAARFGFMLAFPIIFGSGMKKLLELHSAGLLGELGGALLLGAVSAFVVGMLVIHYLLRYLKHHTLMVFIVYRVLLAALVLAFL